MKSSLFLLKTSIGAHHPDSRETQQFGILLDVVVRSMMGPLTIAEPGVVRKSYPSFWRELAKVGVGKSDGD